MVPHGRLGTHGNELCPRWAVRQDREGNTRESRGHAGFWSRDSDQLREITAGQAGRGTSEQGQPHGHKAGMFHTAYRSSQPAGHRLIDYRLN